MDIPKYPDLRVSTVTPANMQLIQQAGAWQELQQHQAAPTFQHMQVRCGRSCGAYNSRGVVQITVHIGHALNASTRQQPYTAV